MTLPVKDTLTYANAIHQIITSVMEDSDHTIIMGQGVDDHKGIFGTTTKLAERFGAGRVIDMPIAEEAMTGIAAGAALNGLYPIITHIRADFIFLACNQIINLIAKYKYMFGGLFEMPMLIRAVVGRSWGQGAQHSQSPQSLFAHIPGLTVVMPSDSQSILKMYPYIIKKYRAPVISFEHRLLFDLEFAVDRPAIEQCEYPLASYIARKGEDITIVATSVMVLEARRAALHLAETAGISCEIIDLVSISHPNTRLIVDSVKKTRRLLVADTSWGKFGVGAEISRLICEHDPGMLKTPLVNIGLPEAPCPTAKSLEDNYYPNLAGLVDSIAQIVKGEKSHGITLPDETSMRDVYSSFRGPF